MMQNGWVFSPSSAEGADPPHRSETLRPQSDHTPTIVAACDWVACGSFSFVFTHSQEDLNKKKNKKVKVKSRY